MERRRHVSSVHVLRPGFASESASRHTPLLDNLQIQKHAFQIHHKNLKAWMNFWHKLINEKSKLNGILYLLCISFWFCTSFQIWQGLSRTAMQSQSRKTIFIFAQLSQEACERCAERYASLSLTSPYPLIKGVKWQTNQDWVPLTGHHLAQCSLSLPLKEMLQITEDVDWDWRYFALTCKDFKTCVQQHCHFQCRHTQQPSANDWKRKISGFLESYLSYWSYRTLLWDTI